MTPRRLHNPNTSKVLQEMEQDARPRRVFKHELTSQDLRALQKENGDHPTMWAFVWVGLFWLLIKVLQAFGFLNRILAFFHWLSRESAELLHQLIGMLAQ